MVYSSDEVRNILKNLDEDPNRIIFTEHFLEEIDKRNISDVCLVELLESGVPIEIREIDSRRNRFELCGRLEDSGELAIIVQIFNSNSVILISAFLKNGGGDADSSEMFKWQSVHDPAFDLMDIHTQDGFRYFQTVETEDGFRIDFDSCGQPIAVEIIGASDKFRLKWEAFSSTKFNGSIEITREAIAVRIKATPTNRSIKFRVAESEIPNTFGIPPGKFEFDVIRQL